MADTTTSATCLQREAGLWTWRGHNCLESLESSTAAARPLLRLPAAAPALLAALLHPAPIPVLLPHWWRPVQQVMQDGVRLLLHGSNTRTCPSLSQQVHLTQSQHTYMPHDHSNVCY
jgi:hypothetical protein